MDGKAKHTDWRLSVLLIVFAVAGLPARAQYGGGDGTAENPYLIETAEQMNTIALHPEDWDTHFRLVADIDMNDLGGSPVRLIGSFQGVFDGNDHTIANLAYEITGEEDPPEADFVTHYGLFRTIWGPDAVVKNLGLIDPNLRPASTCLKQVERVGALVGWLSHGAVRHCFVKGGMVVGDKSVGGLIGESDGAISDCWSSAEVSGQAGVGGLIGKCRRPASVSRCHTDSLVSGQTNIGGLVGSCSKQCSIEDCFSAGSVTGGQRAGGLVGYHEGSVSRCYSTASVSAGIEAGGLVGLNGGTIRASWAGGGILAAKTAGGLVGFNWREDRILLYDPVVADCYATGRVGGEDILGGLIGHNQGGTVLRCYSVGAVTGQTADSLAGGLVGANDDVPMWDCFWDTTTSGLAQGDGGIGVTTAEMQDAGLYITAGWDFAGETVNGVDDIWTMFPGEPGYPRLAWEQASAADNAAAEKE